MLKLNADIHISANSIKSNVIILYFCYNWWSCIEIQCIILIFSKHLNNESSYSLTSLLCVSQEDTCGSRYMVHGCRYMVCRCIFNFGTFTWIWNILELFPADQFIYLVWSAATLLVIPRSDAIRGVWLRVMRNCTKLLLMIIYKQPLHGIKQHSATGKRYGEHQQQQPWWIVVYFGIWH